MTTQQKHGEVDWSDDVLKIGDSKGKGKDQFLKLKPGSNLIRVLTLPHQYYQHKYKFSGEKGFGHRINCSAKHGHCPVCAEGDKPKKRWLFGVIDRGTNSYKILDVSWAVLSGVQSYAQDEDWGNTDQYDFDIVVNPNGGALGYYKAVAKPKRPLSAQDLLIRDEQMDLADLERRCTPPEPSKVEERFRSLMEEFLKGGDNQAQVEKPVSFPSTKEDTDFPNADTKVINSPF